jgi:hypothetical protein
VSTYPNAIAWFEIYVDDLARAKQFYSTVLGISFQDVPAPDGSNDLQMSFFPCDPDPAAMRVGGALVHMEGARGKGVPSTSTMVYFPCEDCSVEASRVEAAGGTLHKPKFPIGEFGFCAICLDSEGNTFGLHSMQ